MKKEELRIMTSILQELGLSSKETVELVTNMNKDLRSVKKLWRNGSKSNLIKLAFTLITFPEPTPISETLGAAILVAGLVQKRIRKSTLYVEDVYKMFQEVNNDIMKIRQFRT